MQKSVPSEKLGEWAKQFPEIMIDVSISLHKNSIIVYNIYYICHGLYTVTVTLRPCLHSEALGLQCTVVGVGPGGWTQQIGLNRPSRPAAYHAIGRLIQKGYVSLGRSDVTAGSQLFCVPFIDFMFMIFCYFIIIIKQRTLLSFSGARHYWDDATERK